MTLFLAWKLTIGVENLVGDQWISRSALAKLEMPETSLRVNHPQTGEEGYRVGMEVFHQLHCLNLLRRVTYKEYYEPLGGELSVSREKLQKHTGAIIQFAIVSLLDSNSQSVWQNFGCWIDHCIEVLRLNLQCNADIGIFTLYLIEGDPLAWPQLNSKHVCRNFNKVRQWGLDHSVGNMEWENGCFWATRSLEYPALKGIRAITKSSLSNFCILRSIRNYHCRV